MEEQLIATSDLAGMRVVGGKNGAKRIGKIRSFVFHPKEKRCIGFIVKRPDLLWMFRRKDKFVSLQGYDFEDGRVVVRDEPEATDRAACKSLGVNWDECVLWTGLPVVTECGQNLGMVGSVVFDRATGAIDSLETNNGATTDALLGKRTIPSSLVKGFKRGVGAALSQSAGEGDEVELGAILVSDEAQEISAEGGMAEKAGKATAVAMDKAHRTADKAKPVVDEAAKKTGEVVNKGAYVTGKQISKTKTMFSDFKSEYDKARGPVEKKPAKSISDGKEALSGSGDGVKKTSGKTSGKKTSTKKKQPTESKSTSESGGKAVGSQMKKASGMFAAFKEEYDKARHDDE